jgi:hypothetical protein
MHDYSEVRASSVGEAEEKKRERSWSKEWMPRSVEKERIVLEVGIDIDIEDGRSRRPNICKTL